MLANEALSATNSRCATIALRVARCTNTFGPYMRSRAVLSRPFNSAAIIAADLGDTVRGGGLVSFLGFGLASVGTGGGGGAAVAAAASRTSAGSSIGSNGI